MKAKPFKGAAVPGLIGMAPTHEISRAELVALVASKIKRKQGDDEGSVRNRISSMVTYDVQRRKLHLMKSGKFRLGDVAVWACGRWPGYGFEGLPLFTLSAGVSVTLPRLSISGEGYTQVTTLDDANRVILVLRNENRALQTERAALTDRVQRLEADVRRYRPGYDKRVTKGSK
jgi:hypothetical protein